MSKVEEADAVWFKSSYSAGNGECVEVALLGDTVGARDSKQAAGPVVTSSAEGWRAFVAGVVDGSFGAP
ncbi:hypothetical protein ADL22_08625 [Streptomyces sp. NRRL F-4489]|uniref:DUF397 domain-containing protein n=1 Tax=Streptomyces sp. NRRL F-4489 TaxID=1609095 RepID=UPI00074A52A3|nr:DUF397 domain-containing protein [Streptomyces sp. NRRL F-4489]KUL49125.1 hypothetical protein ADL22_08625 [Streptomyces sp. NRRL F-4489]